jgi:thiamine-phosphate pyrophosphorylase
MTALSRLELPPIYPIVDADYVADPLAHARTLMHAGAPLLQLRAKKKTARQAYELGVALREATRAAGVLFVINDRPDLAAAVDADILHLGQDDLPPSAARALFGGPIGLSTHNVEQVCAAMEQPVAYLGFGPVFATGTKENPDPVTGLEGLAAAVKASRVPVVAIGGITRENVTEVWNAGAASAAVISALGKTPAEAEEAYRLWSR